MMTVLEHQSGGRAVADPSPSGLRKLTERGRNDEPDEVPAGRADEVLGAAEAWANTGSPAAPIRT